MFHGQGHLTNPNGSQYIGGFKDGYVYGQGIYTYANGLQDIGFFDGPDKFTPNE
jgi:hypothetical protein